MSRNGKTWGVPYSYYQWGVYYRKDIYDKLGLSEPKTWNELLSNCDALKGVGVTPFTIGTKYLWTAAGVFDYLNLRTNGYDVHNALTDGKLNIPMTVFEQHSLIGRRCLTVVHLLKIMPLWIGKVALLPLPMVMRRCT
jgi:ABC-type glycerol-3-phosphate transport system substrate-binding protein